MSDSEKVPLVPSTSRRQRRRSAKFSKDNTYLLLSMPLNEEKAFVHKLNNIGNYSGTIVAVSAVIIVILLIVGITYHADVKQLGGGGDTNKDIKQAYVALSSNTLGQGSGENTEITFPLGRMKGFVKKSRKGRDYLAFYKVPYAKEMTGHLRFKNPQPAEPWSGVREFTEPGAQCIQKAKYSPVDEAVGEEDCLYSNIYVPGSSSNDLSLKSLPTLVYVHGGGFGDGNGSRYGAGYFMDEEVVLITFEYRLGLLGFLNTGDRESSGNMGFKDQVMMLKWARDYISHFGGDPGRVTIFGNSAGGFSVGFLMISPMAKGLFHRAISQSGTSLTETYSTIDLHPELTKNAAAEAVGCPSKTSADLIQCLQKVGAKDIALLRTPDTKFALTVEHNFSSSDLSDVFMPEKPYDILKTGKASRVPYIVGVGATEWLSASLSMLNVERLKNALNSNFSQLAPELLQMDISPDEADIIKKFYFEDKNIDMKTERNLTNLLSDRIMVHGSKVAADLHSQFSETYLYYLTKTPKKSYAAKILANFTDFNTTGIVSHADEIQFLFPYSGYPEYPPSDSEYFPFSEFMVKLWAHFAATGNPALNTETEQWKSISPEKPDGTYWFELNDQVGLTPVLQERMKFWDTQFSHKQLKYEL